MVLAGGVPEKFITHYSVEELVELAKDRPALRAAGIDDQPRLPRPAPRPPRPAQAGDRRHDAATPWVAASSSRSPATSVSPPPGDHRYGLPEATLGILPGGCGTQRLSRLIGAGRAIDFILRGRICRPEEALALGLVHEVAADAARARDARRSELVTLSAGAIAEIKRAVYQGSDTDLEGGLEIERHAFIQTMLCGARGSRTMAEYTALPFEKRRDWLERKTALIHARR